MRLCSTLAPLLTACALASSPARAEADASSAPAAPGDIARTPGEAPAAPRPADTPPPSAWEWMSEPDAPGATQKMVGWVATWLGVSVTVLGGVSGVVALTEESAAAKGCNEVRCFNDDALAHNDHAVAAARLADITVTTGLGILGVGLTVFLTAPSTRDPELSLLVRPGGLALRSRF